MRDAGDEWPATVPVQVDDLLTQGTVVWLGARDDGERYWTRSADQVDVRPIAEAPKEVPPESSGTVVALVELPAIGHSLRVLGVPMEPHSLPRATWEIKDTNPLVVPAGPALDVPDPTSPSEHWRWCALAQLHGQRMPQPSGTAVERLWARHIACLWLAGLDRVRRASPAAYAEVAHALTSTAVDEQLPPPGRVAAWIARPEELRALLSVLLDSSTRDEQVAQSALSWLRAHWLITMWVECDAGDRVRIAAINPLPSEQVVRLSWMDQGDLVPVAMLLPARSVTRQWLDRPPLAASDLAVPVDRLRGNRMEATLGQLRRQIAVGPREYPVRPPGLSFSVFMPPLSLAAAQVGAVQPPPPEWRTWASLRRRHSRWELLVECMRPAGVQLPTRAGADSSDEVALTIGDPEAPLRTVRVTADGRFAVDGGAHDGAAAGFMRWEDRWRARIEIPEAWLPGLAGAQGDGSRPMMLAVQRKPGQWLPRQTAALSVPQWVRGGAPVMVDLGAWSESVIR